ncbi:MAG: protease modulator HflC [Alphaproteobacteria bacterium]
MNPLRIVLAIGLLALGIVAFSSIYTVNEREQALVLQFGKVQRLVSTPGIHFKMPLLQNVTYYDRRVLEYDASAVEIPTQDQKQVVVDSFTRYRIVDPLKLFQTVGNELGMREKLVDIVGTTLRAEFGKATMAAILTPERAIIMARVAKQVKAQTVSFGINVLDVRIKRVDLPAENSQAIFRRMQTQREQEARRIRAEGQKESKRIRADADKQARVILAEANKKGQILRGEGDGLAQKTYNEAYGRDRDFYDFWVRMRTARASLAGDKTRYVGPPVFDLYRMFPDVTSGRAQPK